MKTVFFGAFFVTCTLLHAADKIESRSTYAKSYGATKGAVTVDPAKDLPRYPAVEPRDAIATWNVKNGFHLELTANEPEVRDPVAICFDENGRMFACEMIDYSEMRDVSPHLGRVSVLRDVDGDGHYEKSSVFADDLPWPTGLIWATGGLFVIATPDIWFFQDKDGDGRAEVREKVFTGFGTGLKLLNVQGLANSPQWGQDNRIHILAGGGNRGVITCPKRPDMKGVELGGKDFWFDPLTLEFGVEAGGAQYGMSFDTYGRKFGCSNSDHLQAWIYDDRYALPNPAFQMPSARKSIAVDGGAAEVFRISPDEPWRIIRTRWRIAGVVKGVVEGGGRVSGYFTGATGTTIYRGDAYGPEFVNNSFSGDAGGQLVHRKVIRPTADGVGLEGERPADERGFEFAASKDTWVRVVNFANAPDGCLHIIDMYREVIEHPWSIPDEIKQHLDLNNGNTRGRVYRIAPDNADWKPRTQVSLGKATLEELVQTLSHQNGWHRDTAARLIYERQDKAAVPLLQDILKGGDALAKLQALGALQGLGALNEATLIQALGDRDGFVRERAVVLSGDACTGSVPSETLWHALRKLTHDPAPRVRMALALILGSLKSDNTNADPFAKGALQPKVNIEGTKFEIANASADNPWITAAVLNGIRGSAPRMLENVVSTRAESLNGTFTDSLLAMIGQSRDSDGIALAIRILADADVPKAIVRTGLKAFAEGLRKGGTSISKVDVEGRLAAVFSRAASIATSAKASESDRLEAIDLLGLAGADGTPTALQACLASDQSAAIQSAAVRTLGQRSSADITALLISSWPDLQSAAKDAVLAAMLAREDRSLALLAAIQAKSIPADVLPIAQVQALVHHKSSKVSTEARTALASVIPPSREEVVAKFKPAMDLQGETQRGLTIYQQRCLACHRAGGIGMQVGPDLVTVKSKGRDGILTAILKPHKEVAPQYIAYTVNTKDGQTATGIIARDDASALTLKIMGGVEQVIQRSNILGSSSSGQSLMPEGLEAGLTVQDMADLLTFIEKLQ